MAPMSFTSLNDDEKDKLRQLAKASIATGLDTGHPLEIDIHHYPEKLRENGASFVTLHLNQQLRGCIGSLSAYQPLVMDIAQHAFDAAFRDPRFSPVSKSEFEALDIHISILTPAEPMQFKDEEDLLKQIKPGEDGLILESGYHKGTFLPSVWEQLPEARDFLNHLKLKAGLDRHYWSDDLKVSRYHTLSFW